ncbi:hypothetical protein NL676_014534 [Syzygium grande]|nr:hypothetical protein NL676_014534 [Syzygium grande]
MRLIGSSPPQKKAESLDQAAGVIPHAVVAPAGKTNSGDLSLPAPSPLCPALRFASFPTIKILLRKLSPSPALLTVSPSTSLPRSERARPPFSRSSEIAGTGGSRRRRRPLRAAAGRLLPSPPRVRVAAHPLFSARRKRLLPEMMFLRRKNPQNHPENDSRQKDEKVSELRAELGPLSGRSLKYCTDGCLRRYLVARNWNVEKSKKMLEESLKWRSTYKPEEIRWPEVAHEGETGKVSRADFHDRFGRTVLIMRPGKQNTRSAEGNIRHLVYLIENSILNLAEGQESMSWLIDFTGWTLRTQVPVRTALDIINVLQSHYPERLAVAFLYNPPRIFEAFWKAIKYFLDPKTFEKVKFVYPKNKDSVELMSTFFDVDNLPSEFGGKATLKYNHEEFSRMMAEDDIKTAKFWAVDDKPHNPSNGHVGVEASSILIASPAS